MENVSRAQKPVIYAHAWPRDLLKLIYESVTTAFNGCRVERKKKIILYFRDTVIINVQWVSYLNKT